MAEVRLARGYDIRLAGAAPLEVQAAPTPKRVAIKPTDFHGVKFKLLVTVGDTVKAGSPLCQDKNDGSRLFTSPASGEVVAINRGARRALQSIVVELDGKNEAIEFPTHTAATLNGLAANEVLDIVKQSGLVAQFQRRPFAHIADPSETPRDIFVTTFDTAPLAADPNLIVKGNEDAFQMGLMVAAKLTSGRVHLSVDSSRADLSNKAFTEASGVVAHRFSGPHPAGNVGVQIHHIAPIAHRNDVVWTINVQGLILIGRLFLQGRVSPETVVCLAGTSARSPGYYKTILGAEICSLLADGQATADVRVISGNVLTGKQESAEGFIGFYDNTLSLIPEKTEAEFCGWQKPGLDKESYWSVFLSGFFGRNRKFVKNTGLHGGKRAFVMNTDYEEVLPMDIFPAQLLKSILYQDIGEMEGLGIYEVSEEDIALCEYICPSKIEMQKLVREGLDYIENEG